MSRPPPPARNRLTYGGVPVPYTVSWTAEETISIGPCPWGGTVCLIQPWAQGEGKPRFGAPHSGRQRQVIAEGLCDLCALPLKLRTKVSLSHARPSMKAAKIGDILQVEPLLCKDCARISLRHCPSLKRDVGDGSVVVRQVTRYRVQMAVMSSEYCLEIAGRAVKAVGHAKVQLLAWTDRDEAWLGA